jgi:hypothetical protein
MYLELPGYYSEPQVYFQFASRVTYVQMWPLAAPVLMRL